MPQLRYQDAQLRVETGVDAHAEFQAEGQPFHYHRTLGNCIKITAESTHAHFIQFVTRQVPHKFMFEQSEGAIQQWEKPESHYMTDPISPQWRIDVKPTFKTCYYDEKGITLREDEAISIYDHPGGWAEPREERAVFCTFVVMNNHITHCVKWSKQYDVDNNEFYDVVVEERNHLPQWAAKILRNYYSGSNKQTTALEERLLSHSNTDITDVSEEEIHRQAREDFLQPSDNWQTLDKYPKLFEAPVQIVEEQQEESSQPVGGGMRPS